MATDSTDSIEENKGLPRTKSLCMEWGELVGLEKKISHSQSLDGIVTDEGGGIKNTPVFVSFTGAKGEIQIDNLPMGGLGTLLWIPIKDEKANLFAQIKKHLNKNDIKESLLKNYKENMSPKTRIEDIEIDPFTFGIAGYEKNIEKFKMFHPKSNQSYKMIEEKVKSINNAQHRAIFVRLFDKTKA